MRADKSRIGLGKGVLLVMFACWICAHGRLADGAVPPPRVTSAAGVTSQPLSAAERQSLLGILAGQEQRLRRGLWLYKVTTTRPWSPPPGFDPARFARGRAALSGQPAWSTLGLAEAPALAKAADTPTSAMVLLERSAVGLTLLDPLQCYGADLTSASQSHEFTRYQVAADGTLLRREIVKRTYVGGRGGQQTIQREAPGGGGPQWDKWAGLASYDRQTSEGALSAWHFGLDFEPLPGGGEPRPLSRGLEGWDRLAWDAAPGNPGAGAAQGPGEKSAEAMALELYATAGSLKRAGALGARAGWLQLNFEGAGQSLLARPLAMGWDLLPEAGGGTRWVGVESWRLGLAGADGGPVLVPERALLGRIRAGGEPGAAPQEEAYAYELVGLRLNEAVEDEEMFANQPPTDAALHEQVLGLDLQSANPESFMALASGNMCGCGATAYCPRNDKCCCQGYDPNQYYYACGSHCNPRGASCPGGGICKLCKSMNTNLASCKVLTCSGVNEYRSTRCDSKCKRQGDCSYCENNVSGMQQCFAVPCRNICLGSDCACPDGSKPCPDAYSGACLGWSGCWNASWGITPTCSGSCSCQYLCKRSSSQCSGGENCSLGGCGAQDCSCGNFCENDGIPCQSQGETCASDGCQGTGCNCGPICPSSGTTPCDGSTRFSNGCPKNGCGSAACIICSNATDLNCPCPRCAHTGFAVCPKGNACIAEQSCTPCGCSNKCTNQRCNGNNCVGRKDCNNLDCSCRTASCSVSSNPPCIRVGTDQYCSDRCCLRCYSKCLSPGQPFCPIAHPAARCTLCPTGTGGSYCCNCINDRIDCPSPSTGCGNEYCRGVHGCTPGTYRSCNCP